MKKKSFLVFIKSQKFFFSLVYKEHPAIMLWIVFITILTSLISPYLIVLNKNLIDDLIKLSNQPSLLNSVILLVIIIFSLQYLTVILQNFEKYIFTRISQTVNFILKQLLAEKTQVIPMKEFEDSSFYDTLSLAKISINTNGVRVINDAINILGSIISLLGILGILITIHWSMPVALFVSTLPGILLLFISKVKNFNLQRTNSSKARNLGALEELFYDKRSIREVKMFNLGKHLLQKWSVLYKEIQKDNLKIAFWEFKTNSIAVLILQSSSVIVSIILINQIFHNALTIGDYVALLGAVTTVQAIFASTGGNIASIFETAIYNNALLKILDYKVENKDRSESVFIHEINTINLENVSFVYPGSNDKVLDSISLNISKNEKISIVGYNGSGKTTLVNCILGLYYVTEGAIKVNNYDIQAINKEQYFKKVTSVFQDFMKYKLSMRDNIGFGNLEKLDDDKELYGVLEKVKLHEKTKQLSEKLDTFLTKEIPGGSELSGGEWQRVAIARGFLRSSDLIILDEPTAALDPISELKIFELFQELSVNKTTITISHRLGPTKSSDRIIVMDKGKIVEEGKFDELMEKRGLYYEMYTSQKSLYENASTKSEEV